MTAFVTPSFGPRSCAQKGVDHVWTVLDSPNADTTQYFRVQSLPLHLYHGEQEICPNDFPVFAEEAKRKAELEELALSAEQDEEDVFDFGGMR